jgi:Holliday junction DNA helicase RuvB
MARQRVISGGPQLGDEDRSLRPRRLSEVVGQRRVIGQLNIALEAARRRGEPLEHVLLDGPPGLGKTTLAHVIANELGTTLRVTSGPAMVKLADLMSLLTGQERGDILFIDEVHRLNRVVEEYLYPAMEDFRVDVVMDGGYGGGTLNFPLPRFTLIAATTRVGGLTPALRDRFGIHFHFEFYQPEELAEVARRAAQRLGLPVGPDVLEIIAGRSRGTPRVAIRLLRRVADFALVKADNRFEPAVVHRALEALGVDALGLDDRDREYLRTLLETFNGGPAGIDAIAASMGQERDTLEDVVEPYLLQIGFVVRTRQGRLATPAAYEHLGLAVPADRRGNQMNLF